MNARDASQPSASDPAMTHSSIADLKRTRERITTDETGTQSFCMRATPEFVICCAAWSLPKQDRPRPKRPRSIVKLSVLCSCCYSTSRTDPPNPASFSAFTKRSSSAGLAVSSTLQVTCFVLKSIFTSLTPGKDSSAFCTCGGQLTAQVIPVTSNVTVRNLLRSALSASSAACWQPTTSTANETQMMPLLPIRRIMVPASLQKLALSRQPQE